MRERQGYFLVAGFPKMTHGVKLTDLSTMLCLLWEQPVLSARMRKSRE